MFQVTEGCCALERAAGAVNIYLLVLCGMFSASIEATPPEWRLCDIIRLLWDGWARLVCETRKRKARRETIGLAQSHLYSLWIYNYSISFFVRVGCHKHNTVLEWRTRSKKYHFISISFVHIDLRSSCWAINQYIVIWDLIQPQI